ncbi:MAG: di-trans,poly-cis-decaprenylcistransferase [Planctomycetes bacterium]|nr:di-trans,poly-cis-decaprenylcistransferase [Planctomycetota bacterium]
MDSEQRLENTAERLGIRPEQAPRNIAIIMDGNGRWAQQRSLLRAEGHCEGAKTAQRVAQACSRSGIKSLTLYSFSMENWKRPKDEVDALMGLYEEYLISMRPMFLREDVRLLHLGRMDELPEPVQRELTKTIEQTRIHEGMTLALALNYSGRGELIDATKRIAERCVSGELSVDQIDEFCLSQHLYTASMPDPDLVIRTADESRISNFLLWQISYSEFYVTKTLWPEFDEQELDNAILAYAARDRRFGAIDTPL